MPLTRTTAENGQNDHLRTEQKDLPGKLLWI